MFGELEMFIAAVLLALLSAGLFVGVHFSRKRLATLIIAKAKTAAELTETATSVGREIGAGGFRELVELVGAIECPEPLVSPLGQARCVSYSMRVVREYEEDVEERDAQGKVTRRTQRGSETLQSDDRQCPFALRDATGVLPVSPVGADFDGMVESVSKFERGEAGTTLRLGSFSLSIPGGLGGRRRTLGYRYTEQIFPVDRPVTLIGEATDAGGALTIRKGADHGLIVSTRTRQALRGSAETRAKVMGVGGTLAAVGAVVCAILGVVRG